LKEINDIFPTYGVKGLANVEFEKKRRGVVLVKSRGKVLDIQEVVVNASFLDEGALRI
jgi:hypothetical protein